MTISEDFSSKLSNTLHTFSQCTILILSFLNRAQVGGGVIENNSDTTADMNSEVKYELIESDNIKTETPDSVVEIKPMEHIDPLIYQVGCLGTVQLFQHFQR